MSGAFVPKIHFVHKAKAILKFLYSEKTKQLLQNLQNTA